ncbi:hypothetical protein AB1L42_15165 [Thalassoglobus sp. JC818]|uniref:hypothetical protein n=1 Tax=Thalassoglobus sp. JC818 TaxID=3232136 RepID=UPI003459BFCD
MKNCPGFGRMKLFMSLIICLSLNVEVMAQVDFDEPPISYSSAPTDNPITKLQKQLDEQEVTLRGDNPRDYLGSLLDALDIPKSSQALVFSKTSLQLRKISPKRPRALYFNDDTYVGWVQGGDVIEISTVDPSLGAVFYTLSNSMPDRPEFVRDQGQCLACHESSRTHRVPGHLMRSVFVDHSGQPHFGSGTYTTTQASPFEKRWGGWYVTGQHGALRHMGNVIANRNDRLETLDREPGANVTDLSELFDVDPYLESTSDIVALLVLTHQLEMHNLITRAVYETRSAEHYDTIMNAALDRPADYRSESTERRIASAGEKLLQCLLFADEAPLGEVIEGSGRFREEFEARGPFDKQGRSLRQFKLEGRLFRYPCSYLIYSDSFDALPPTAFAYVGRRLQEILSGDDTSGNFGHLSQDDRSAIREILSETKSELFRASDDQHQKVPADAE